MVINIKLKALVFLIAFFAIGIAYGEDYSGYSSLEIKTNLSSEINIKYDSGGSIDYVNADITLYPINNDMQNVLGLDVFADPNAMITKGNTLGIKWENVNDEKLSYSVISDVKVVDNAAKVSNKIGFPIQALDYDYLKYTKATEFIDVNDDITNKANEIANGETDMYKTVFKIAEWVRKNVNYTLDTLTEKAVQKSSWVLEHKEGVCDEITNLFISMVRSQGIPARFVSGMVYTNVNDNFGSHGWAEVYFPGYGWIPFDVTFGQYGLIDTSHVVLKYSLDSGESSVDYSWRSRNIELSAGELIVNSEVINKGGELTPKVKVDVNALKNDVGENSFVPVEIIIENLQDHYLSDMLYVIKSLGLTEENSKAVLLRPREIKKLFWIVKIPSLKEGYKYESVFEVKDNFNSVNSAKIRFALNYKTYNLEQANELVSSLSEVEEKVALKGVELNCVLDKEYYYMNEIANVSCNVKSNEGGVSVCLMNTCKDGNEVHFDLNAVGTGRIIVLAKKDDKVKYSYLDLKVIEIPNLTIKEIKPIVVDYSKDINLTLILESDYSAKNVLIDVDKTGALKLDSLIGKKEIGISISGVNLLNGLEFDIEYFDEVGKMYEKKQFFDIKVEKVPFLIKLKGFFLKLFNRI